MTVKADCVKANAELFPNLSKKTLEKYASDLEKLDRKAASNYIEQFRHVSLDQAHQRVQMKRANVKLVAQVMQKGFEGDRVIALRSLVFGDVAGKGQSVRLDPYLIGSVDRNNAMNLVDRVIEKHGIADSMSKGLMDDDIRSVMHALRGKDNEKFSSFPVAVQDMARALSDGNDFLHDIQRQAGIRIGYLDDYIGRQSHDSARILGDGSTASKQKWIESAQRTFREKDPAVLSKIYDEITDETYAFEMSTSPMDNPDVVFKQQFGPASAKARSLHAESAEALNAYLKEFGSGSLLSNYAQAATNASRRAALVSRFGPDWKTGVKNAVESVKNQLGAAAKSGDVQAGQQLELVTNYFTDTAVQRYTSFLNGDLSRAGKSGAAKIAAGFRTWEAVKNLGNLVLGNMTDLARSVAAIRTSTGDGLVTASVNYAKRLASAITDAPNAKQTLARVGQSLEDFQRRAMMDSAGSEAGLLSKGLDKVLKFSGFYRFDNAVKATLADYLSNSIGDLSHLKFSELPARMRNSLSATGFNDHLWDIARKGLDQFPGVERKMLTVDGIRSLPDEEIGSAIAPHKLLRSADDISKFRNEAANRLGVWFADNIQFGTGSSNSRIRYISTGGMPDEGAGILARTLMQFKNYPMHMHHVVSRIGLSDPGNAEQSLMKALASDIKSSGQGGGLDYKGLGAFAVSSATLALVANGLRSIGKGDKPELDVKRALLQSGIGGLAADLAFSDPSRLAGPLIGDAFKIKEIFPAAISGDKRAQTEAVKFLKKQVPFNNTPGIDAVLNYWMVYHVNEALNPGSAARYERSQRKRGSGGLFP